MIQIPPQDQGPSLATVLTAEPFISNLDLNNSLRLITNPFIKCRIKKAPDEHYDSFCYLSFRLPFL